MFLALCKEMPPFPGEKKRKKVLKFIVWWWLGLFACLHTCYQLMFLFLTSEWSIEIFVIDHIHVRLPFTIIRKPPLWKEGDVLYRCIEILTNFNSQPVCFLTFCLCTTILDWKGREVRQKPALPERLIDWHEVTKPILEKPRYTYTL